MIKNKIQIYSAICGDRDIPRKDNILCFGEYDKFKNPNLNAKIYKVLPHLFLDTEWSVWIDGNITLKVSPEELVKMTKTDIGVFPHPERTCLYREADYCMKYGIGVKEEIAEQVERYRKNEFPSDAGMSMCGLIVRKHTSEMKRLCEQWWAEICRGSNRDQISFPYVFNGKVSHFPHQCDIKDNQYFHCIGHQR